MVHTWPRQEQRAVGTTSAAVLCGARAARPWHIDPSLLPRPPSDLEMDRNFGIYRLGLSSGGIA